ncbi:hypothetical protein LXM25_22680 [Dyadobacter sp. LJ53]|uniref:hypothetical protein n=1 Tax=Dyadobacter chenwenxiniae TaxID=2906456 RepID=UPI001F48AEC1|nr:hypothetical protein [Dyadobacter chenwenxiniae]MCF0052895.1 hypothetical protein [Dyadobacter chenwenxiniae]
MSNFELRKVDYLSQLDRVPSEGLNLTENEIEGVLVVYTGQQGSHMLSVIPSLNVSGYGNTEEGSINALKENLETLFVDLFEVSKLQRQKELFNLGWRTAPDLSIHLSWSNQDEASVLQNFDFPERVKTSILQAA